MRRASVTDVLQALQEQGSGDDGEGGQDEGRDAPRLRRDRVSVLEEHFFEQRLTHAGGDTAVLLPFYEEWIEHGAAIVDRGVPRDGQVAGCRVDLDFDFKKVDPLHYGIHEIQKTIKALLGIGARLPKELFSFRDLLAWGGISMPTFPAATAGAARRPGAATAGARARL